MKAYRSHAIIHDPSKRLACPFDNCPYVIIQCCNVTGRTSERLFYLGISQKRSYGSPCTTPLEETRI